MTHPFASLVFVGGRWLVTNPAADLTVELEAFDPSGLPRLARGELAGVAEQLGLTTGARKWASRAPDYPGLFDTLAFLSHTEVAPFVDYSTATVFDEDRERMEKYSSEPPPPSSKNYPGRPKIHLPHPSAGAPLDVEDRLAAALYFSLGRVRAAGFLGMLPAQLRAVPSQGARHPVEGYLWAGPEVCVAPGFYHYDGVNHALEQLDGSAISGAPGAPAPAPAAGRIYLFLTVIFERFQWRYRDKLIYKDLWHEIGHIQGNLKMFVPGAREIGGEFFSPEWPELVEEVYAVLELEGFDGAR